MVRKKLILLGIVVVFLLSSSVLIAAKVFASTDSSNVAQEIPIGVGEQCPFGSNIDFSLVKKAQECLNKNNTESKEGVKFSTSGDLESYLQDPSLSSDCKEILSQLDGRLISIQDLGDVVLN